MHRLAVVLCLLVLLLPASASAQPFGFVRTQTDQLALPGEPAGVEITPEGSLYTGYAELGFWWGPQLRVWDVPLRTYPDARVALLRSAQTSGGVRYTLEHYAHRVDGIPVAFARFELENLTGQARTAQLASAVRYTGGRPFTSRGRTLHSYRFERPVTGQADGLYLQAGEPYRHDFRYRVDRSMILRDGRALAILPSHPGRRAMPLARAVTGPTSAHARTGYRVRLPAHGRRTLTFMMPFTPQPVADAERVRRIAERADLRPVVRESWRRQLAAAMRISLPERKVTDTFYASLVHMLQARYRTGDGSWVQTVNKLQYHAFWLRDAAVISNAFDLAGLHRQAGENLDFFARWQRPDGLFISRRDQFDGVGQALWALGEHAVRTADRDFARRWLPAADRAAGWIDRARRADPLGLMPFGDPGDGEMIAGHLAADTFWAYAGLQSARKMALLAADPGRAARFQALAGQLARAWRSAMDPVVQREGHITPAVDTPGGELWGNLWAAYPDGPYPAHHPHVQATIDHVRGRLREGLPTWRGTLHHYLGFRLWQTELALGRQAEVLQGLYAALSHTTASHGGFEMGIRPYSTRSVLENLTPHGWFAAEYVSLVRNMLVREVDGVVELGAAVAPGWLHGRGISVRDAPTLHGKVSWRLRPTAGGATLTYTAPRGTRLRLRVPAYTGSFHASSGQLEDLHGVEAPAGPVRRLSSHRVLWLDGSQGTVRLRFTVRRGPSYQAAVRQLCAAYAGKRRPIGSCPR